MDLILWRHAEAAEAGHDVPADDLARPLTARGARQAARMAQWLHQHLPATTRVVASPARRAQQTVQALERSYKTLPALAPGASVDDLLAAVRWPGSREAVLVVGHQPTLGQVAAQLVCGAAQPWSVRKGAIWWLRQRERDGDGQVVVVAVRGPDHSEG